MKSSSVQINQCAISALSMNNQASVCPLTSPGVVYTMRFPRDSGSCCEDLRTHPWADPLWAMNTQSCWLLFRAIDVVVLSAWRGFVGIQLSLKPFPGEICIKAPLKVTSQYFLLLHWSRVLILASQTQAKRVFIGHFNGPGTL